MGGPDVTTVAQFPDEVVTQALVRYVEVPGLAGELALITLDNGFDHTKPNTFGPGGLASLDAAIDAIAAHAARGRGDRGHRQAVHLRRRRRPDRHPARSPTGRQALELGRLGHRVFRRLRDSTVPTFAFVNGAAMGGGLEVALHCHYRTLSPRGRGARAARGVPRPGARLGRHPAAART